MEIFQLCPSIGTPTTTTRRIPSTMIPIRATKLHFFPTQASLVLLRGCTHRPTGHAISPVVSCAVNRSSTSNTKYENHRVRGMVGASLAMACALGVLSCSFAVTPKAIAGPPTSASSSSTLSNERTTSQGPQRKEVENIKKMEDLMKSGKLDEAVKLLGEVHAKNKNNPDYAGEVAEAFAKTLIRQFKGSEQMKDEKLDKAVKLLEKVCDGMEKVDPISYGLGMSIAEIRIRQEKYTEASKYLPEITQSAGFDDRHPLFKAIIYTMSDDNKDKAREFWSSFQEAYSNRYPGCAPISLPSVDNKKEVMEWWKAYMECCRMGFFGSPGN